MKSTEVDQYSKEFMDKVNEVSKFTLEIQADSFNAIDTKAQTFISIIAILIAIILGILAISFNNLSCDQQFITKFLTVPVLISLAVNMTLFFVSIRLKEFKSGVSPSGLNELRNNPITKVEEEIFRNLYWSADNNIEPLAHKTKYLKFAENLLIFNVIISIVLSIIFIVLL